MEGINAPPVSASMKKIWAATRKIKVKKLLPSDIVKKRVRLHRIFARLEKSPGNQFTACLALLAYSTRSMKFIAALDELLDMGLDGPDWEIRLRPMRLKCEVEDELDELQVDLKYPCLTLLSHLPLGRRSVKSVAYLRRRPHE